jgi:pimeloyl-ACP methyl ester carboxylesterase
MDGFKHGYASVNDARLHYVEAGHGPLVVLLHGFPELWYSWRHQLSFLARHGYRAVAVDQRGYGRSSKFWRSEAYRIGPPGGRRGGAGQGAGRNAGGGGRP